MGGVGQIDRAVQFGQPDADAVGVELSDDGPSLSCSLREDTE